MYTVSELRRAVTDATRLGTNYGPKPEYSDTTPGPDDGFRWIGGIPIGVAIMESRAVYVTDCLRQADIEFRCYSPSAETAWSAANAISQKVRGLPQGIQLIYEGRGWYASIDMRVIIAE